MDIALPRTDDARTPRLAPAIPWIVFLAAIATAPFLFSGQATLSTLCYLGTMAIFALSYNMLLGETGLLSLGHATFFGLGGFIAAHAVLTLGDAGIAFPLPFIPVIGGAGAFVLGLFGGWLASRRGGMAFAMITLGLAELVYAAAALFPSIYGSEEGIAIDRMDLGPAFGLSFGPQIDIYIVVAGWLIFSAILLRHIATTPFGLLANAVRDNAERVEFLGFSAPRVRMASYAVAAGVAGIAGSLAALNFEIITVNELGAPLSMLVLLMTYIGGTRHFFGPVLGAVVVGLMKVWLSDLTPAWMMYFGLLFIFVVMVAPGGLAGIVASGAEIVRGGRLVRELPLLAAIGAAGAAALAGTVVLVELAYRGGLDAASGPEISVLWMPLSTHAVWSWAFGGLLLAAGAFAVRRLTAALTGLRHDLASGAKA